MKQSKPHVVSLRLTDGEYDALCQCAEAERLSVSEYVRTRIHAVAIPTRRKITVLTVGNSSVMIDDQASHSYNISSRYISTESTITYPQA